MVKYCIAALLILLTWLSPGLAQASPLPTLLAQTAAAQVAISDADLATFAKAYQGVQVLRMQAEQEMVKAVEDEGLTIDRFNAIAEIQLDTSNSDPADMAKIAARGKITKKENKKFDAIVERIIEIRQSTEEDMAKAIEAEGLSIDTFNSILDQSVADPDLQRKISDEIVKQTIAVSAADS